MLDGKKGVILGVANKRSLAWAIANTCATRGAQVALTYQGDRFKEGVNQLARKLPGYDEASNPVLPCDVTKEGEIARLATELAKRWGSVDFVVHSIAFANADEMKGRFRDTSREGFQQAMDVSCFSLIPLAQRFSEIMPPGGSILALSYLGGERVVPNYNVMGVAKAALDSAVRYLAYDLGRSGIRVNALAPGPVKTVSAAAIGDFGRMLDHVKSVAPMRRNVTHEEVGSVAAFLVSDLASGLTGSHIPVDCGYSIMGAVAAPRDDEEGGE